MKYAKIGQLRDGLSRYLNHVRDGDEVLILDRERPVARIIPAGRHRADKRGDAGRLADLERRGLIRQGRGRYPGVLKAHRPSKVRGSVLADLRTERDSGW